MLIVSVVSESALRTIRVKPPWVIGIFVTLGKNSQGHANKGRQCVRDCLLRDIFCAAHKTSRDFGEREKRLPEDEQVVQLRSRVESLSKPLPEDAKLLSLKADFAASQKQVEDQRVTAAEDIAWALINSPAFLFNH